MGERADAALPGTCASFQWTTGPPATSVEGVNRVVVYIDDLDRVPPARVVEVPEAIHLLLAFELFVVVVAVDTRWIEQSLRTHYRRLLAGPAYGAATPLDYVEKIVQLRTEIACAGAGPGEVSGPGRTAGLGRHHRARAAPTKPIWSPRGSRRGARPASVRVVS